MIMKINKLVVFLSILLSGCSINSDLICKKCININENNYLLYENQENLKFYEGNIDKNGLYNGKGKFYYRDNSIIEGESKNGFLITGTYTFFIDNEKFSLFFNNEKIDPVSIYQHSFKNEVILKKINGFFSYEGNMKNLIPFGYGTLYKDNLIFKGFFNINNRFTGNIENNEQTKVFKYEASDNSSMFVFNDFKNNQKTIYQGFIVNNEKFNGVSSIYFKDKELISYEGVWDLKSNPFNYKNYIFLDLQKNGVFKVTKNKTDNEYSKGNFIDNKKNGFFETYKKSGLIGFEYYKDDSFLYYIPFYMDIENQLINKENCQFNFPQTINLWYPISFNSCKNNVYNIDFIDKENKKFLFNMTYDFISKEIKELIVFNEDHKYIFKNLKEDNELEIKKYLLKGNAEIYQFVDGGYKYLKTAKVDFFN